MTQAARQHGSARVIRTRLNIFIEREHARRLSEHASLKGISKSSIVAAALASFLSPDAADQRGAISRRLDRLARQFERLERDQNILIETVALYVRYFLSISTPIPEDQQEAARALGRARFEKFIEQLATHLQRGRSLVADVHNESLPEDRDSFDPHESGDASAQVPLRRCDDCELNLGTGPGVTLRAAFACPRFGKPRTGVEGWCPAFVAKVGGAP